MLWFLTDFVFIFIINYLFFKKKSHFSAFCLWSSILCMLFSFCRILFPIANSRLSLLAYSCLCCSLYCMNFCFDIFVSSDWLYSNMPWCGFVCVFPAWGLLSFLGLRNHSSHEIWTVWGHMSLFPALSFPGTIETVPRLCALFWVHCFIPSSLSVFCLFVYFSPFYAPVVFCGFLQTISY